MTGTSDIRHSAFDIRDESGRADDMTTTIAALVEQATAETHAAEATQSAMAHTVVACRSGNAKIGRIPATSRSQATCPPDCPLMGSGCYGENRPGRPSLFDMVGKSADRAPVRPRATLATVRSRRWRTVPRAVRFNVVGDYLTESHEPDREYIRETNETARAFDWVAWSYTHAWSGYGLTPDLFDYVVRASCQSREEVERAHAAGWFAAVVDPGPESPDTLIGQTIDGRRVVQCPVQTGRAATCEDCRLCGRPTAVVAFAVHGSGSRRARRAIAARRAAR